MVKGVMDFNLTFHLKYLFRLMETLFREVLNLELVFRLAIRDRNMKGHIRCIGVTNIGRNMTMFIMNRNYWDRFNNFFFQRKGNLKFDSL